MGKENIVEQWYGISKEIVSLAEKLPRAHKFTLGDRLVGKTLDLQEYYIEAYYVAKPQKCPVLQRINIQLEQLRFLLRLCFEKGLFTSRPYHALMEQLQEIGRQTGGWKKALGCDAQNTFTGK